MSKKTYFAPTFMVASGGIDITQSQEGSIGGGDVQTDFISYLLNDGGFDQDILNWVYSQFGSSDPAKWIVDGFDYSDRSTWGVIVDYVYENYPWS